MRAKNSIQRIRLESALAYAKSLANALQDCNEPVLAMRAGALAQVVDLVLTEADREVAS